MSQVSSSYACSLHFAFVNKSSKSLLPLCSNSKNKGEVKTVRSKCVALWGRLTPSTSQNTPCGSHLNYKNKDNPAFSASQEPISSTRWKTSKTKRNFLTYNRFTGNHPRIFGNSNEGSYLHKKRDFSRQMAIFAVFLPRDARRFSPRIPWRSLRNAPCRHHQGQRIWFWLHRQGQI